MFINRSLEAFFRKLKPHYPILAIVGPRQSGKTTFLKSEIDDEADYLSFDNPDIREQFDLDIKLFERKYLREGKPAILDEVQNAENPGQKLKYLADNGKILWITGSSEILLSANILSFLVGRVSILRLYPFNLEELLRAKGQIIYTPAILARETEEHLIYGGYPKIVLTGEYEVKKKILQDLYETMILKDIKQTFSIEDHVSLEKLSYYFAVNTGTQLSIENVSQIIGLSYQTIKKYLDAMEKSYLLYFAKPYFTNRTRELIKQPKVYFLDTGLRNAIRRNYDIDGNGFENYVVTELIKAGFKPKYWRTKTKLEVDIVIEKDNEIIPIEVKLSETKVSSALKSFINDYNPKRAYIAVLRGEINSYNISGCTVKMLHIGEILNELTSTILPAQ